MTRNRPRIKSRYLTAQSRVQDLIQGASESIRDAKGDPDVLFERWQNDAAFAHHMGQAAVESREYTRYSPRTQPAPVRFCLFDSEMSLSDKGQKMHDLLEAMETSITQLEGDPDEVFDRWQSDSAFKEHMGQAAASYPFLEFQPETLHSFGDSGAEAYLRGLPQSDAFQFSSFVNANGHVACQEKEYALCRCLYPIPMSNDKIYSELAHLGLDWRTASFLDLGAFLRSQKALPKGVSLFAPASSYSGYVPYTPRFTNGTLVQHCVGDTMSAEDMVLLWRPTATEVA